MRVLGTFLVVASLLGFIAGFALTSPEFLALPLGGYFGELTKGGALAVYVLSASTLFLGLKLITHDTQGRHQGDDSVIDPDRVSNPFNK